MTTTLRKFPPGWLQQYRDHHEAHRLYRCYDADGVLIYIGCTIDVQKRMRTHLGSRKSTASVLLQRFLDRYEVDADVYTGRLAGQAAEAEAIRTERPVFNLQHGGEVIIQHNRRVAAYVLRETGEELPVKYDSDGYEWGHKIDAASLLEFFARTARSAA